jgi:hypothetical protein
LNSEAKVCEHCSRDSEARSGGELSERSSISSPFSTKVLPVIVEFEEVLEVNPEILLSLNPCKSKEAERYREHDGALGRRCDKSDGLEVPSPDDAFLASGTHTKIIMNTF